MRRISGRRWLFAFIPLFLILGIALLGGRLAQFAVQTNPLGSTVEVAFLVPRGTSPKEVSHQLENNRIISSADQFYLLGKILQKWKSLKTGEYLLSSSMSPLELFQILSSGVSIRHPVTIREGQNMFEAAQAFEKAQLIPYQKFIDLCRNSQFIRSLGFSDQLPQSLEGYLFPDTYSFTRFESHEEIIRALVKRYRAVWADIQAKYRPEILSLGLSEHQIITLASIIEKETGAPEERPLISSVFHNRLRKKMRLQSDPTTIYGIWEKYRGNITKEDLLTLTPFNTYKVEALPVGPISNPGSHSIEAAIKPAISEYLFFVSQNEGRHIFTTSFGDHNKAVQKFQVDPKARAGKSWRQLKGKRSKSGR